MNSASWHLEQALEILRQEKFEEPDTIEQYKKQYGFRTLENVLIAAYKSAKDLEQTYKD